MCLWWEVADVTRLLGADTVRMYHSKCFWMCLGGMLIMAVGFLIMQGTAMDYTVPLSRVIFLPMSFYGVAVAALVSMFVGEDFNDGFIRNKLIAGRSRKTVFLSTLIVCWAACVILYLITTGFTYFAGRFFFEADITLMDFWRHLLLGILTCLAYGSIFCTVSTLVGKKAGAVLICMGLAFLMLFLSLHTNQVMVQPEYKNGLLNPHYVRGPLKAVYAILHDCNPTGQAAQLSAMHVFQPVRWIVCDLLWMLAAAVLGTTLFQRADIR